MGRDLYVAWLLVVVLFFSCMLLIAISFTSGMKVISLSSEIARLDMKIKELEKQSEYNSINIGILKVDTEVLKREGEGNE